MRLNNILFAVVLAVGCAPRQVNLVSLGQDPCFGQDPCIVENSYVVRDGQISFRSGNTSDLKSVEEKLAEYHSVMPTLNGVSCPSILELDFTNSVFPEPDGPVDTIEVNYSYVPMYVERGPDGWGGQEGHYEYGNPIGEYQEWTTSAGGYVTGKAILNNGERTKQICMHGSFEAGSDPLLEITAFPAFVDNGLNWASISGYIKLPVEDRSQRFHVTALSWWGWADHGVRVNGTVPLDFNVRLRGPVNAPTE